MPSDALSHILQGASSILRPRAATEVVAVMELDASGNITLDSHSNEGAVPVLSDLARLYGHGDSDPAQLAQRSRDMATSRRLGYSVAHALRVPSTTTLRVLADKVLGQSKLIVLESCVSQQSEGLFSLMYIVSLDL